MCIRDSIKEDAEGEDYSVFLKEYKLTELIRKYSDYIRYPIQMAVTKHQRKEGSPEDKPEYEDVKEVETINSMVPLWQRRKGEVTDEEYNKFYQEKFFDYVAPVSYTHLLAEDTEPEDSEKVSSPRGLPMAMTLSPTLTLSESPMVTGDRPVTSTLMTAIS